MFEKVCLYLYELLSKQFEKLLHQYSSKTKKQKTLTAMVRTLPLVMKRAGSEIDLPHSVAQAVLIVAYKPVK